MSWLKSTWARRIPVTVNNVGGSATIDVALNVPAVWPDFWDVIDADGHEMRLTDSDGVTEVTWQRQTWDYANKSAVLQVDAWAPASDDATVVLWLYWEPSDSPADVAGTFTATTPKTAEIRPSAPPPRAIIVPPVPLSPGEDSPSTQYSWPPGQSGGVYFSLRGLLSTHPTSYEGKRVSEEVSAINVETRNDGNDYSAGYSVAETRLVEHKGEQFVMMWLTGGVDNADYVDEVTVTTTEMRTLIFAAVRYANTPEES